MTIFLKVLIKLIRNHLGELSRNLQSQTASYTSSYIYNSDLSMQQKEKVDTLEEKIGAITGTNDDAKDMEYIVKLLETYRVEVKKVREKHGEQGEEGHTIKTLNNMVFRTKGFYGKLKSFEFNLLNKEYNDVTPDGVVYYHAAYYFGEEVFNPSKTIDPDIRKKKEDKLKNRLVILSELIKPEYDCLARADRTLGVLQDLASDNKQVIKKDDNKGIALPGLSFWGFSISTPSEWFSASEGRLGAQLNLAISKINELKELFNQQLEANANN